LVLTITDIVADGVDITSTGPAEVDVCSNTTITFSAAGQVAVGCGSITIIVIDGPVEVVFTGDDGTEGTTTLDTGDNVTFDPVALTVTNNGAGDVVISVNGETITVGQGQTQVIDVTPPEISVSLKPVEVDVDDDEGLFIVTYSVTDNIDPNPVVAADINGIPVENGQLVQLAIDDDTEVEEEDGVLQIEAPSITLTVEATDISGNTGTATAEPEFADDEDDEEEDDD